MSDYRKTDQFLATFAQKVSSKSAIFYRLFLSEVYPENFEENFAKSAEFSANLSLKIPRNLTFFAATYWKPCKIGTPDYHQEGARDTAKKVDYAWVSVYSFALISASVHFACENIRFSSLFAAGTFRAEKRPQPRRARRNGCFRRLRCIYWS